MFRTNLRKLREDKGLSRMDIVRQAGVSYPTVLKWENSALRRLDSVKVKAVITLLECRSDDLIYMEGETAR